MLDIALSVEPAHSDALEVKKSALEALLVISGSKNLSETMWLKPEIADTVAKLETR